MITLCAKMITLACVERANSVIDIRTGLSELAISAALFAIADPLPKAKRVSCLLLATACGSIKSRRYV